MMYLLYWYWFVLSNPLVGALWIVFGGLICFGLAQTLPQSKWRPSIVTAVALIYFTLPITLAWGASFYDAARRQRQAWISAMCKETMEAAISSSVSQPLVVDGFLDKTDQDKFRDYLYNRTMDEAWQRAGPAATSISFSTESWDLGRHPYNALYGGGGVGVAFNGMALRILRDKRFSYVEFEMLPKWFGRGYTNAGIFLNTDAFSGVKYRRYHLAPSDHPNCVAPADDGRWGKRRLFLYGNPGWQLPPNTCLALEVTSETISRHSITATEETEAFWTVLYPRGIPLPMWASVQLRTVEIRDLRTGKIVSRFEGFDYPEARSATHRCYNLAAVPKLLQISLVPDEQRTFLRRMKWYAGSNVQQHYEQ